MFSLCVPIVAADEEKTLYNTSVNDDLQNAGYDLDNYSGDANDKNLYLITLAEYGYDTDDYSLFIYVYNPSGKTLNSSDYAKLQLAYKYDAEGNPTGYNKYDIVFNSVTNDNLLVKLYVKQPKLLKPNVLDGTRIYWVSGLEMQDVSSDVGVDESGNVRDYDVSYAFSFTGKGSNISCYREDFFTLKLNVHQTSYLTGDSAKGEGYSNQINSVYFSIPQSVEEKYGDLYAVDFEYYKYRTAPIIITDNQTSYDILMGDRGTLAAKGLFLNSNNEEYYLCYYDYQNHLTYLNNYYSYFIGDLWSLFPSEAYYESEWKDENGKYLGYCFALKTAYSPTYNYVYSKGLYERFYNVFKVDSGELDNSADFEERKKILISADELQDYFLNYNGVNPFFGRTIGFKKYPAALFESAVLEEDYSSENYYDRTQIDLDDKINLKSFADVNNKSKLYYILKGKWGYALNKEDYDNGVEDVLALKRITSSDFVDTDKKDNKAVNDNLLVSSDDIGYLIDFQNEQSDKGENTYLLHYDWTDDYYSTELAGKNLDGKFLLVEQNVYIDFDIISLDFKKGEKITTIAVVSDPTDGFTGIQNTTPNHNLGDNLKEAIDDLFDGSKRDYKSLIMGLVMGLVVIIGGYALINVVLDAGNSSPPSSGTSSKDSQQIHIHNYGTRRSSGSYRGRYRSSNYRKNNKKYRYKRRR